MSSINISEYYKFTEFLNKYEITNNNNNNNNEVNIINQGLNPKKYYIPNENIDEFFQMLNNLNDYNLNFSEKQRECNGIFIDIDRYNKTNERIYNEEKLLEVIENYIENLLNYISLEDDMIYKLNIYILSKDFLRYDEKKNLYKEGYHILIPNLYLPKYLRRKLLEDLHDKNEDIDINAYAVPNLFYGNVKKTESDMQNKYKIKRSIEYIIKNNKFRLKDCILPLNCNIAKELSLTYNGDIDKIIYCDNDYNIEDNVETINFEINTDIKEQYNKKIENNVENTILEDNLEYDLELLEIKSSVASLLKKILDILPERYYEDRTYWRNIIYGIYSAGITNSLNFKLLAEYFSKKSKTKFNKIEFNNLWEDTINRYNNCEFPITEKTIFYYAKSENYDKYKEIIDNSYIKLIEDEIFKNNDVLTHYTLAKILHILLDKSLIFCNKNWYYFITDNKKKICYEDGLMYKWYNEELESITLSTFISEDLKKYIDIVIEKFNKLLINENNKIIIEEYKNKIKKLRATIKKLGDSPFKKNIITQCKNLFIDYNFENQLDNECPYIIGVRNGIILLPKKKGERARLINGFHEYKVKKYTNLNYIEYDENNIYIQGMLKILKDIIYEEDVLTYILTYLASSLNNLMKEPILFLWQGSGANAKSTILEMIKNVLGPYAKKLPLSLITDKREGSQNANSALMQLKGARFGYFSEPEKNETLNTGRVKELLSGESLSARDLHSKQEIFENRALLIAASNYDFMIPCSDNGIWRRIRYYNFKMKFCENPSNKNIFEKLINKTLITETIKKKEYLEGFLSILVHYYNKYINEYDSDLKNVESKTIVEETLQYRLRQDILNKFIMTYIVISPNNIINIEEFVLKYKEWCALYHGNIKNNNFGLDEIQFQIENSVLSEFSTFDPILYKKIFKGIRLLGSNEIILENEIPLKKYLLDKIKK
jgi:phage/plasmid-associated DNA primase